MSVEDPELTVVIPFWDMPNLFLERAVRSVALAAPVDTAILVVDNASDVPPKCVGVEVIHSARRITVGAARNVGLTGVRTTFCLFLDADDELLPGAVFELLAVARRDTCDVVAGRLIGRRTGDSEIWKWGYPPNWVWSLRRSPRALALVNVYRNAIPVVGAAVLRTASVRRVGGFGDSDRGEDWALSVPLALSGRLALLDHPCLVVEVRPDSLSSKDESLAAVRETRRDVRRRLRAQGPWRRLLALSAIPVHLVSARRRARLRHAQASARPGSGHA